MRAIEVDSPHRHPNTAIHRQSSDKPVSRRRLPTNHPHGRDSGRGGVLASEASQGLRELAPSVRSANPGEVSRARSDGPRRPCGAGVAASQTLQAAERPKRAASARSERRERRDPRERRSRERRESTLSRARAHFVRADAAGAERAGASERQAAVRSVSQPYLNTAHPPSTVNLGRTLSFLVLAARKPRSARLGGTGRLASLAFRGRAHFVRATLAALLTRSLRSLVAVLASAAVAERTAPFDAPPRRGMRNRSSHGGCVACLS